MEPEFWEVYRAIDRSKRFIFYSPFQFKFPRIEYDFEDLFKRIRHGHKESCYWIAVEPFKFFMDLDIHKCSFELKSFLPILDQYFNQYLVSESIVNNDGHSSFSVFTDFVVTYEKAIQLQSDIQQKTVDAFGINIGIDNTFSSLLPFSYRRSPFSFTGGTRSRISLPRKELSRVACNKEIDMFMFSYPNLSTNA